MEPLRETSLQPGHHRVALRQSQSRQETIAAFREMASSSQASESDTDDEEPRAISRARTRPTTQRGRTTEPTILPKSVAKAVVKGEQRILMDWLDTSSGSVDARDDKGRSLLSAAHCMWITHCLPLRPPRSPILRSFF